MTKIERVMRMIYGEAVDRLPIGEFYIDDGLVAKLLQLSPSPSWQPVDLQARIKASQLLGLDALVLMADQQNPAGPWAELHQWQKESDFFLFAMLDGPFQGVWHSYTDFTEFLMDIVRHEEKVECLIQESLRKNLELGKEAIRSGAHGIMIGDDIAYNHGLYISPAMMRERFFPNLKELVQNLAQIGKEATGKRFPIFFHSDGNIQLILTDLKEMGFQGIHSLEPVMDLAKVRETVGSELCLMGGYDLSWFEAGGLAKADELLTKIRPGSYIFGSSAGILDSNLAASAVLEVYGAIGEVYRSCSR